MPTKKLAIENYPKLLKEYGLPKNTPHELVLELLEMLDKKRIPHDDAARVEPVLAASRLWAWATSEHQPSLKKEAAEIAQEFNLDTFARRISRLFGA